jgi:PAS domain S-box-containing protein
MSIQQERRRFLGQFLFCVMIVFSATGIPLDAPAREPQKTVLALYGSRPDLPANVLVDEIIRSTLERELGPRLDFYAEFLDTARWPEAETQAAVRDFLHRRYAQKKISVIIAVAQPAITFMRIYGDELFPGVPIVAYGPSGALRDWEPGRAITGTLGKVDLSGTVELMLRLQPRTREILVISGAFASDQWLRSVARDQLDPLEKRVKFTYLTGVPVEDLVRTVARIPDTTTILFLSMRQDSAGNNLLSHEVLARIAKEARVPVYSQSGSYVGLGSVGGVVFNPESLGRETAQLTLRVLRGERLRDLPVQESKSTVPMVDWRQLKRWGLDEKRLPAGTVVRFREASVWQSYKWYIIGGISLILLETLFILGLIWQRERRRRAEVQLRESEERFRLVANSTPVMIWTSGTDKRCNYVNHAWLKFTGRPFDIELGNGWTESVHPEDLKFCLDTYTSAFDRRESFEMQYRLRRSDGEYRWIFDLGVPRFNSDGSFAGYIGSCIDVSERKVAEDALMKFSVHLIEAQEEERKRIARELHDDYNQRLAMLAIDLEKLAERIGDPSVEAGQQLHEFFDRVSELGADLHSLSHNLHSSTLDSLGLVAGVRSFCEEFAEQQQVQIDFAHENVPRGIPAEIGLCMFRIAQEGLRNVKRHSGADRAEVRLEWKDEKLHLSVSDRGRGFEANKPSVNGGIGIRSMEERLRILGGHLEIHSQPSGGTRIDAWLPFETARQLAS